MISNDERHEAAIKLRFTDHNMTWSEGYFCIAEDVGAAPTGDEHDDVLSFAHALADLIEPEPERTTTRNKTKKKYGRDVPICECCGYSIGDKRYNFCPNCGAKVVK